KATKGCPASRSEFSRALADSRHGKTPLDFSGFCWLPADPGALEPLRASLAGPAAPVIPIPLQPAVALKATMPAHAPPGAMAPALTGGHSFAWAAVSVSPAWTAAIRASA